MSVKNNKRFRLKLKVKRIIEINPDKDHPYYIILKKVVRKSITVVRLIYKGQFIAVLRKKLRKFKRKNNKKNTENEKYIRYFLNNSDLGFYDEVKPIIEGIPISNGSRYYPKFNVNIGIIADEFLFNSFKGIANFIYITQKNYLEYVNSLDLFIVASVWKGLDNEWKGIASDDNRTLREQLFQIIDTYKSNGIKCIFYSKEDPVNYDCFIEIAQKCEYIFTTAAEVIEKYENDCNNNNVNILKFGVNPIYHNPIGFKKYRRNNEVLFAGSWYKKYPEREKDTIKIFDGILNANYKLKIIDRNYNLFSERFFFPEKYIPYVSPKVNHEELQGIHKLYDWSINLNSVKYSPSMFANRVVELQALGNLILSNYSMSVNSNFPNIFFVHDSTEVGHILYGYTDDELYKQQVQGIRKVMSNETTVQRLEKLLEIVKFPSKTYNRTIAVLVEDKTEKIKEMFNYQTYTYKHLITIDEFTEDEKSKYDMVTFFHKDKEYFEYYLEDMINAFKYTNSAYITKDGFFDGENLIDGIEHDFVSIMKDKYRTIFWAELFSTNNLLEMNGNVNIENGYSIDHFEFNNQIKNEIKSIPKQYKFSIIIPAYNNGEYLLNKCFYSLKRSSMFADMEIIIVDDGSTDSFTPTVINRLAREYSNISTYFYSDGGSGTASRPRNKGIEMSSTEYIAFLDPDNEAINDGYAKLYHEIIKNNFDFVVGNIYRIAHQEMCLDYVTPLKKLNNNQDIIHGNNKELLVESAFKVASIQALVVKKSILIENNLQMVVGAAGEDSLFFEQLLLYSKKIKLIEENIHVYYANIEGSIVNTITSKFFKKYSIIQPARISFLKENGLLEAYSEKRFESYFNGWFLKKLKFVKQEDALEAVELVCGIWDYYKDYVKITLPIVGRFDELSKLKDYQKIVEEFINPTYID